MKTKILMAVLLIAGGITALSYQEIICPGKNESVDLGFIALIGGIALLVQAKKRLPLDQTPRAIP